VEAIVRVASKQKAVLKKRAALKKKAVVKIEGEGEGEEVGASIDCTEGGNGA